MRSLLFALVFCVLCVINAFAEGNPGYYSCWQNAVISDYIDYRPGEAVIRRDYWNNDRGMGVCNRDTVTIPEMVANMLVRGVNKSYIVGEVVDTVCDSAMAAALCESQNVKCLNSLGQCDNAAKGYLARPIEVFYDSLNLLTDTLAGYTDGIPMVALGVHEISLTNGSVVYRALNLGEMIRFVCSDGGCSVKPFEYAYVESGDSVMLCSKDSVLRRNGVCLDLQALRDTAGSVNVRPWPKQGDASVDPAVHIAGTTRFSRVGSMLKMDIAKAGMLEVSAVDGKVLRRTPVLPGERWLNLSAFAPGFLAVRVGGASTSLYWEGTGK